MSDAEKILSKEIENGKSPSVQYYLFNEKRIIKSFKGGYADIDRKQKTGINTTYHAYSITKTFTALAILQLEKEGKIDINQPVILYLPEFPYGAEITVKQILTHSAGIPNPIPLSWIHPDSEHKSFNRDAFFGPVILKNKNPKSKPNEKFAYSNLGYIILGQLIEKVSGKLYEEYISETILRKLPISENDLTFSVTDSLAHATGYHKKNSLSMLLLGFFIKKSEFMGYGTGGWKPFKNFYVNGTSYGGLIGKPTAFVKYIQELLKDSSSIVSEDQKQIMFCENKTNRNKNTGMCLSWFTGELNGVKYYAHAGGGGGYYCEIRIYPEIKTGSVIFFNRTGMTDERYLDKLDRFYVHR